MKNNIQFVKRLFRFTRALLMEERYGREPCFKEGFGSSYMIHSDLQWKEGSLRLCPSTVERRTREMSYTVYVKNRRFQQAPRFRRCIQEDSNICLNLTFIQCIGTFFYLNKFQTSNCLFLSCAMFG